MYPLPMNPIETPRLRLVPATADLVGLEIENLPKFFARLRLVPATADLVGLEIENLPKFFEQLSVEPIPDWPSEDLANVLPFFLEELENDPSLEGWLAWYWILDTPEGTQLVGGGGFKGFPAGGFVEIGYQTRVAYRRQGIATEAISALATWALKHPAVQCVVAQASPENAESNGLLHKLGFKPAGPGSETGQLRFELRTDGQNSVKILT